VKIASAKVPDKFTHGFLNQTLGFKNTNDRAFIPLLRTLGFLDQSGSPTSTYRLLKNATAARGAIGAAIRKAYAPLFEANENAHALTADKLNGLVAQVAGTDEDMTARIVSTFTALTKVGDVSAQDAVVGEVDDTPDSENDDVPAKLAKTPAASKPLRPEFHYNIQVHLPSNGTEEVYLNIFNALRKAFQ
jgi:hypothetical protein